MEKDKALESQGTEGPYTRDHDGCGAEKKMNKKTLAGVDAVSAVEVVIILAAVLTIPTCLWPLQSADSLNNLNCSLNHL